MKKVIGTLFLFVSFLLSACSNNSVPDRAQVYYESMATASREAYDAYNDYTVFSQETELEELGRIDIRRMETIATIQQSIAALQSAENFEGDASLRLALVEDLSTLNELLGSQENELINIRTLMRDATPQSVSESTMERLLQQQYNIFSDINKAIEESDASLAEAKQRFLQQYEISDRAGAAE